MRWSTFSSVQWLLDTLCITFMSFPHFSVFLICRSCSSILDKSSLWFFYCCFLLMSVACLFLLRASSPKTNFDRVKCFGLYSSFPCVPSKVGFASLQVTKIYSPTSSPENSGFSFHIKFCNSPGIDFSECCKREVQCHFFW